MILLRCLRNKVSSQERQEWRGPPPPRPKAKLAESNARQWVHARYFFPLGLNARKKCCQLCLDGGGATEPLRLSFLRVLFFCKHRILQKHCSRAYTHIRRSPVRVCVYVCVCARVHASKRARMCKSLRVGARIDVRDCMYE